ncbi:MAG: phage scaffolding protein [Oscillospiraceae bacterium]
MLEKLKALLGDAFTEELGAKLDAAIAEGYLPKTDFDAVTTQNGELKAQLGEASNAIAGFKAMDIDGIKKAADDWKLKAEQAEKDATAKIADMQFSNLINGAIGTAKGKNAKAIMALLDIDALKESKNQAEDIKLAIDSVAKENEYMFDSGELPPPLAAGTGTASFYGNDEMSAVRTAAGLIKEGV